MESPESIINFRELGGIRTEDGLAVRAGCLFRGGDLSRLSETDSLALSNAGMYCIVDFRDTAAVTAHPDRPVSGAGYYHLPALSLMELPTEEAAALFEKEVQADPLGMLFRAYRSLCLDPLAHKAYRRFFELLLEAGGRPVYWHCTQGKDRTGIAAALLLTALGCSREEVLREYMLTNRAMRKLYDALLTAEITEEERKFYQTEMFVRRDCLESYFNLIDTQFDGSARYLLQVMGVGPREKDMLRRAYCCEKGIL